MATVLFAVAMSITEVRIPIPSSPPFLLLNALRITLRMYSKPPYSFISEPSAATRIATTMVSNIPDVPPPIELKAVLTVRDPVISPAIMQRITPQPRTINTLIPQSAAMSTTKYGTA